MKLRTIAVISIMSLLLCCMVWSFGSSAASGSRKQGPHLSGANGDSEKESTTQQQSDGDEREDVDADLGKFGRQIDRDAYLRERDEYIARKRGVEPGRPFDPMARRRAIEQMERQEKGRLIESIVNGGPPPPPGAQAPWTAIGPAPLPNGVGSNAVSGRVTALVVDPTNSSKVYLGTAQGGVWRSLNGGTTWEAIFDNAQSLAVGALALAPSDPTILYVGTGETNRCGDCFFGAGLYRIDTVDTTPSLVGPINPPYSFTSTGSTVNTTTFTGRGISSIVVSPSDPATIFVGTSTGVGGSGANSFSNQFPPMGLLGVYRSNNATSNPNSVTFQKLAVAVGDTTAPQQIPSTGNSRITDMVMEPGNPDNLIVGVFGGTASANGIYRSTNALSPSPTFTLQQQISTNRIQFAINKDTNTGVVKVLAATSETPSTASCSAAAAQQGVLRQSVDGGVTWPATDASATTGGILVDAGGFCGGQCFYNVTVAIDPKNANSIYIGGNVPNTCSGLMMHSTNGVTFLNDHIGLHADSHALAMDPLTTPTTVFTGNDGGVWKRSADAAVGTAWTNLNTSPLNTLQFEGIAVHPLDRYLMIGGTQDNGTEFQQTSVGNWSNAEGGDGGYSLIDQSATNTTSVTMYHTFFNQRGTLIGFDRIINTACLPIKNSWPTRGVGFNPGADLEDLTPVPCDGGTASYTHNGLNINDFVLFYAPMALGPGSPNTVYFGSDRLYRSFDRGDSMSVVSQAPVSGTSPISTIAIWPQGDNVRLVGLQNGQVWATSTGSSTLVNITSASFPPNPNGSATNRFIGRALIDPNNKNVAYIAFSFFAAAGQGIWKITNLNDAAGASPAAPNWVIAGNGIPSVPINALAIDPINSNNIYAGTDIGVYFSIDAGATWNPFGTGLPRSAVFDLAIQPSFRILRAGTHGRGIWEIPLISPNPSTVQFTAGSTSVNEGPGGPQGQVDATVTVTRIGDTSFPATVNYATADTAGANNCGTNNGVASARCDYIATSGTLNFAANETSKNITIPIVDDSYFEGPETFSITLSAPTGSGVTLGLPSTVTVTINDNETSTQPNQITVASYFVHEHYIDFLNREPDPSGLAFWTNEITQCGTDAACIEIKRINVSAAFFLSIEFQQTGYLVERLYKVAYGDDMATSTLGGTHTISVPIIRLNEFLPDTQRIGQGVIVNQTGWEQVLENNKQAFTEEFVQRSRFTTAYPSAQTPAQFVDGLNAKAGGVLSTPERDQLVSDLTAGRKTRAQVLRAVAEDPDLAQAEFNRAFVLMQYFGYLRRNPNDPQDSDYTGYDFWLNKLNQFGGNFVNAEMVKAFITSVEYKQRFGP